MGKIYRRNGVWYGTADDMIARIAALEARVAAADKLADAAGDLSLSKYGLKAACVITALAVYEATKEQSDG